MLDIGVQTFWPALPPIPDFGRDATTLPVEDYSSNHTTYRSDSDMVEGNGVGGGDGMDKAEYKKFVESISDGIGKIVEAVRDKPDPLEKRDMELLSRTVKALARIEAILLPHPLQSPLPQGEEGETTRYVVEDGGDNTLVVFNQETEREVLYLANIDLPDPVLHILSRIVIAYLEEMP